LQEKSKVLIPAKLSKHHALQENTQALIPANLLKHHGLQETTQALFPVKHPNTIICRKPQPAAVNILMPDHFHVCVTPQTATYSQHNQSPKLHNLF